MAVGLVVACEPAGDAPPKKLEAAERTADPAATGPAARRAQVPESPAVTKSTRSYEIAVLPPERLRLTGAAHGTDDLLRTIEKALAERDSVRLFELMATEREYREILFPSFPAAHPPANYTFDVVWLLHYPDAVQNLRWILATYGGKDVRILNVRFEKPDQDYVNFVLDENAWMDLEVDGRRENGVRLFGSVYRIGDQAKVLSYEED